MDEYALKYGFPTSEDEKNVKEGKEPAYIQKFKTDFENEFYKKYYIDSCFGEDDET